jgi:hypothetical protein
MNRTFIIPQKSSYKGEKMKKYSIGITTLALFFATCITISMEPEIDNSIGVHVHNPTNYTISVEIIPTMSASRKGETQFKIKHHGSEDLGRLKDIQNIITSGEHSMSFVSNEQALNRIKNEALRKQNADVYVNINWSIKDGYHIQSWHWVSSEPEAKLVKYFDEWPTEESKPKEEEWKTKSTIFSSEQSGKSPAAITLQDVIINDALGQDYAKKAMTICDADYTKAKESGASDLCLDLKKMFAVRAKSKEDAMRIIDSIYARFQMYKGPEFRDVNGQIRRMPAYVE